MNILLVEPDAVLAQMYAQALEMAHHDVRHATTAQAAIFLADEQAPDLVILELQLVSHSGIEFLYEFRSYPEWQAIPMLVLSQAPPSEFQASWRLLQDELGVTDYLYKPQTSLAMLARSVGNHQQAHSSQER